MFKFKNRTKITSANNKVKYSLIGCLLVMAQFASTSFADTIKVSGQNCPYGYSPVSYHEARTNRRNFCNLLAKWDIANLSGSASISGNGYHCSIIRFDERNQNNNLGHTLCSSSDYRVTDSHRSVSVRRNHNTSRQHTDYSCGRMRKLMNKIANGEFLYISPRKLQKKARRALDRCYN